MKIKRENKVKLFCLFCLILIVAMSGCDKLSDQPDQGWSQPSVVTSSKDGLVGGINLYKYRDSIIVLQGLDDQTARCFLKGISSNSWQETPIIGIPIGYFWAYPTIDSKSGNVLFSYGYMKNDKLTVNIVIGRLNVAGGIAVRDAVERQYITDKKSVFGNVPPSVTLSEPGSSNFPTLGLGIIDQSTLYIPYCISGKTLTDAVVDAPFNNGVFRSDNIGLAWQVERIADFDAFYPSLIKTEGYYYYFAAGVMNVRNGWKLWFSRKEASESSWNTPAALTKTFAYGTIGHYAVVAGNDTVHICWMDSRHNKWRFNPEGPSIENDDIYYCHRKDADSDWSKSVLLSKGLEYCYAPTMSVEGNNVVVTWAGIQTADKWHTDYGPNDIYYVTSKDGGNTWSRPLRVTDKAKDGFDSGKPQVLLLNGTIHLFYIQGKLEKAQEISPGLTRLNQPSWPIYYTERPFPN